MTSDGLMYGAKIFSSFRESGMALTSQSSVSMVPKPTRQLFSPGMWAANIMFSQATGQKWSAYGRPRSQYGCMELFSIPERKFMAQGCVAILQRFP